MSLKPELYPLDLTGKLESNLIQHEVHTFDTPESRIFVPNAGSFFTASLNIRDNKGNLLRPIVDYQVLYLQEEATLESGKNVESVIWVINEKIPEVILSYQAIGGQYSNTVAGIKQELQRSGPHHNTVDWETNVFNKPDAYPPAPHRHLIGDVQGWEYFGVYLDGIRKAILASDYPSWESVFNYFNRLVDSNLRIELTKLIDDHKKDAHAHTKDQVGLGSVENLGVATKEDFNNPSSEKYVTTKDFQKNMESAGYFKENFKVDVFRDGDEVVFVFRSNNLHSKTKLDLTIAEVDATDLDIANKIPDNLDYSSDIVLQPKPAVSKPVTPTTTTKPPVTTTPVTTTTTTTVTNTNATGSRTRLTTPRVWDIMTSNGANSPIKTGSIINLQLLEGTTRVNETGKVRNYYETLDINNNVIATGGESQINYVNGFASFSIPNVSNEDAIYYIRIHVYNPDNTKVSKLFYFDRKSTTTGTSGSGLASVDIRQYNAWIAAKNINPHLDMETWQKNYWLKGITYTG